MKNKMKKRETNIEILRIISMLLIICFHYVYKSEYQYTELNLNTILVKSIWFFGELGVNIFILITGYYLSKSKASIKKIILLILEVLFYHLILCFIGNKIGYNVNENTFKEKFLSFFPVILNKYWFISGYLLVYILSPFYNMLINSLNKRNYQKLLIIIILIWCIIPTIFGIFYNGSEGILYYNRFIWLTIMYFVGAYIRKFDIRFLCSKKRSFMTFIITYISMIFSIFAIHILRNFLNKIGTSEIAYFWTPNNILMLILSVSMFKFFTELKIRNNMFINKLSTTTLGIYLLHDGYLAEYMWKNIFHSNTNIYSEAFILYLLGSTLIIFIVGAIVDFIRQIIEKYTVKKILNLKIWSKLYINIKSRVLKTIDKYC